MGYICYGRLVCYCCSSTDCSSCSTTAVALRQSPARYSYHTILRSSSTVYLCPSFPERAVPQNVQLVNQVDPLLGRTLQQWVYILLYTNNCSKPCTPVPLHTGVPLKIDDNLIDDSLPDSPARGKGGGCTRRHMASRGPTRQNLQKECQVPPVENSRPLQMYFNGGRQLLVQGDAYYNEGENETVQYARDIFF